MRAIYTSRSIRQGIQEQSSVVDMLQAGAYSGAGISGQTVSQAQAAEEPCTAALSISTTIPAPSGHTMLPTSAAAGTAPPQLSFMNGQQVPKPEEPVQSSDKAPASLCCIAHVELHSSCLARLVAYVAYAAKAQRVRLHCCSLTHWDQAALSLQDVCGCEVLHPSSALSKLHSHPGGITLFVNIIIRLWPCVDDSSGCCKQQWSGRSWRH